MKKFQCNDTNCNFEATGDTDDEVARKAREHGKNVHKRDVDMEKIRPQIKNV